jgi:hypothetical protein
MADNTVLVFDEFYNLNIPISAAQYEIVYSYFVNYCHSAATAAAFTTTLFVIASQTQSNVLDLLETFGKEDALKVSLTMAYYLNNLSNKTAMFGVNNIITPNNVVQRNIVQ